MSGEWANGIRQYDPGAAFQQAFQQGQQTREQNMAKAAYAALVPDPSNDAALEALAGVNPEAAMQFKQQQAQARQQEMEQAKAQLGAHYDSVLKGAQLIRQTQPKDQASWDQTLMLARQSGIDISEVPPQFDPNYVQQIVQLADAFKPQERHNPQLVPFTQGGGVARYNQQTGQMETLVMPNDGGHAAGDSVNSVQEGATATNPQTGEKIIFRGGQWQPVGGQAAPPPATFP